jgi:hypothetical protein
MVDAEFDGAAQDSAADFGVTGRALETMGGQTHGAEAEPVDGEITQGHGARLARIAFVLSLWKVMAGSPFISLCLQRRDFLLE